jgi:hypothetical protein
MQIASKAKTVGLPTRLAGFESEEHGHVLSFLLRMTLGEPNLARSQRVEDFSATGCSSSRFG